MKLLLALCAVCLPTTSIRLAWASAQQRNGTEGTREPQRRAEGEAFGVASSADAPRQAALINPVGSVLSTALAAARYEVDSLFSLALRYERVFSKHWGLVVAPHYASASILAVQFQSLGFKLGPRYCPAGTALRGAYVLPMALLGNGWVHQPNRRLLSQLQLGLGFEGGYAWGKGPWQLELGIGLHYSRYLRHQAFDGLAPRGAGWAPLLNSSVGYAW